MSGRDGIDTGDPSSALALAARILRSDPERWRHSLAVTERAGELALAVAPRDRPLLIAAASLHDIGYAAAVRASGFHPLDGAKWLCDRGYHEGVAALVAHHSGARFVAEEHGLRSEIDKFPFSEDPLTDALTTADQTVGPAGQRITVEQRIVDMLQRHGPGSANARAHGRREPYLLNAVRRTLEQLADPIPEPSQR